LRERGAVAAIAAATVLAVAGLAGVGSTAGSPPPVIVAFTQTSGRFEHIWVLNVGTRLRRQVTRGRYGEQTPSWSPDGRQLVYAEDRLHRVPGLAAPQIGPLIVIRDMARGTVRAITPGRDLDETPAWSPVGGRIAFVRTIIPLGTRTAPPEEIWTIGINGRNARQLTHNRLSDIAPAWSPTGRALVYQRARDTSLRNWDLWTMGSEGSRQRLLARNGTRPAWSPSGRLIAFGQPTGKVRGCCMLTDLMVINSDGTHRQLLVRNGGRPTWAPDGSRLVFQRMDGSHFDLWIINVDGSGLRRLTTGPGDAFAAAWQPR
jgi:TolB protein